MKRDYSTGNWDLGFRIADCRLPDRQYTAKIRNPNSLIRNSLRLGFRGRLPLQLSPPNNWSSYSHCYRLDHYVVHHLSITEPLQEQPPQQAPPFLSLEHEIEAR